MITELVISAIAEPQGRWMRIQQTVPHITHAKQACTKRIRFSVDGTRVLQVQWGKSVDLSLEIVLC
uniref:Uncharacterized protein n=1 Tax=Globisporangium ultimum (strain ATCC 200006 / CBS 805.95 / DAOM BR144) TaxID=431595 RepID=K3W633_GLOUD